MTNPNFQKPNELKQGYKTNLTTFMDSFFCALRPRQTLYCPLKCHKPFPRYQDQEERNQKCCMDRHKNMESYKYNPAE